MMSTSEDEPLSTAGRLRPRRSSVAGLPRAAVARRAHGRVRKNKHATTTSAPSAAAPDEADLAEAVKSSSSTILKVLCPYCAKKFTSKRSISKHVKRIHLHINSKVGNYIGCQYCNHSEPDPESIVRHMAGSHPDRYFACLECHTRTATAAELAAHAPHCPRRTPLAARARPRRRPPAAQLLAGPSATSTPISALDDKSFSDSFEYNGVVISCELKPSRTHDTADIEDNITTNLILPPSKSMGSCKSGEKNAVIVLDDIQWNKKIAQNLSSFHNSDTEQILSRLGVVHRAPRAGGGELTRRDWQKHLEDTAKFEKCFDTSFYSKVASNVHENLAKFLDGSFNRPPDPDSIIKTRKLKNSVVINTSEGFPILLAGEQCARSGFGSLLPRALAPRHKWKWDNPETDKHPASADQIKRDSHANNCIITLISSLDIWTQLCMRQKFEDKYNNISYNEKKTEKNNVICNELKEILESREIPNSFGGAALCAQASTSRGGEACSGGDPRALLPAMLGLAPAAPASAPAPPPPPAVLSGEWVRPRCYVCCACGERTYDAKSLSSHISSQHPNAQVSHYDIGGELRLNPDILKQFNVPPSPTNSRQRPLRGVRECTKCKKPVSLEELHQHMLECAGDAPVVKRKCRYRPFGVRRRRTRAHAAAVRAARRKDVRRKTRKNHTRPRAKVRTEVGDGETIRKMLADLPAKRHRVNINPLNQPHTSKKRDLARKPIIVKRRVSDEPKTPKNNKQDRRETKTLIKIEKVKKVVASASNSKDKPKSNLRPRLARTNKVPRKPDNSNLKAEISTRPRTRQTKEKTEKTESDSETNVRKSVVTEVQNEEMSTSNTSQNVSVNSGGSSGNGVGRQHGGRGSRGSGGAGGRTPRAAPAPAGPGAPGTSTAQATPLKHSIASLTANTETHDKSVQFQPHFLVNQECYKNIEKSYAQQVFFQDETPANKLDKPPLFGRQSPVDALAYQKSKLNKPRKGLNACIAMLKNKLEDPAPLVFTAQRSVQCDISEPPVFLLPPPQPQPSPPPPPAAPPAPPPPPAPIVPLPEPIYSEFVIPPAHANTSALSIISTPLDLSGKSSLGLKADNSDGYETLDLSKKNVFDSSVVKDDENIVVDLSIRSIKPPEPVDETLDLSSKGVRIKDDLIERPYQKAYSEIKNLHGTTPAISNKQNTGQVVMSDIHGIALQHVPYRTSEPYHSNEITSSMNAIPLTIVESKAPDNISSIKPKSNTESHTDRITDGRAIEASSSGFMASSVSNLASLPSTKSNLSLGAQNDHLSHSFNNIPSVMEPIHSSQTSEIEQPAPRNIEDTAIPSTSTALVPSTSRNNVDNNGDAALNSRSVADVMDNTERRRDNSEPAAMLPKEIVDILGKMPDNHREQLLSVLPQYMVHNTAIKQLKLVVDIRQDAVMSPIESRRTNPADPQTASESNTSEAEASAITEAPCPPELLNVDTERFLIDPVTGAITERGPRELEVYDTKSTNINETGSGSVNAVNKPTPEDASLTGSPLNTPLVAHPPSPNRLKEVKEKTASLRAVRIKQSERRRTQNTTSNLDANLPAAIESSLPLNEPMPLERGIPVTPEQDPESNNSKTNNTRNEVVDTSASVPTDTYNEEQTPNKNGDDSSLTKAIHSEQQAVPHIDSISNIRDNTIQNNDNLDALVLNETVESNNELVEISNIQPLERQLTDTIAIQALPAAGSSTLNIESSADVNADKPQNEQGKHENSVDDADSDDDISLAVIVKQKLDNQQKSAKKSKNKSKVNQKKSKRTPQNDPKVEDSVVPAARTGVPVNAISKSDLNKDDTSDQLHTSVATDSQLATASSSQLATAPDMPESDDEGKKTRRSRRNRTNKSYNENDDFNLPFVNNDNKDDSVRKPNIKIRRDKAIKPKASTGENNNDSNVNCEDSNKIESLLKDQEHYETIVIDSQTEESQDNSVCDDGIYKTSSKASKTSRRTRNRSKQISNKEVCNMSDNKLLLPHNAEIKVMHLDTPEDSNYASDSTEHSSTQSTSRSHKLSKSFNKDSPKKINSDDISQSSIETCIPLRRSRRGKSLYVDEPTVADNPDLTNYDKDSNNGLSKKHETVTDILVGEENSNKNYEQIPKNNADNLLDVPSKILKDHSDPSNELNTSEIQIPTDSGTIDEEKLTESHITNRSQKPSKRKKNQQVQKDSKKRKSHLNAVNDSTLEELDVTKNITFDADDTISSIVSNDTSIVDENVRPACDTEKISEKHGETDKNSLSILAQQKSLEKVDNKDNNEMVCSGELSVTASTGSESPRVKQSKKKTIGRTSTPSNIVLSSDSIENSPQPKNTRLNRIKANERDEYDISDKDTNMSSNDLSDTEINNGFLQKFAKPMTCYDIPVAAARTRSKSYLNKTLSEDYDPYDIDMEDKLFEETPLIKKVTTDDSLDVDKSKQTKPSKISKKKLKKSRKTEGKCGNKSKMEPLTVQQNAEESAIDSDDSSKSDIPLKKFVSDFAKNSKITPEASADRREPKLDFDSDSSVNESSKVTETISKRKSKRESKPTGDPICEEVPKVDTVHKNKFNNSDVENQVKETDRDPVCCENKQDNHGYKETSDLEINTDHKVIKKGTKKQKPVPIQEKEVVSYKDISTVREKRSQKLLISSPVTIPAKQAPQDDTLPIVNKEVTNMFKNKERQEDVLENEPTQEQIRSEQFLESFGFFAERKPRKSNLLASKKIAETFHIIESEELRDRKKTNKRTERRKSVSHVINDTPSTSAQGDTPMPVIQKDNLEVAKKPNLKPVRHCDVCNKTFRRPDNLLRHQMTSLHINGSSENSNDQEDEEPDYLVIFRHRLDCLMKTKFYNYKGKKRGKKSKSHKNKSLFRYDIIAEAKLQTKHIMSSNKTVARRGLSRDEELFLDCCELMNKCEAAGAEAAPARSVSPAQGPSGLAALNAFDRLIAEDRCDSRSDGDVDSITAQNILESEEVRNLENDLISGLKEAAEKKMASQRAAVDINFEKDVTKSAARVGRRCVNCRTLELFKEYDKQDMPKPLEPEASVDVGGESPDGAHGAVEVNDSREVSPAASPRAASPPPAAAPPPPASPVSSGPASERKRKKSESMIVDQLDIVDMFEDKFDKIKRKCRSQAAAAKQTATLAEVTKSLKEKKKVEKKKNKKCSKKKLHNTIPTKGALKGFDGIKVSIPTSDIDISALVPNLAGAVSEATLVKKRKKNNNKKRRCSSKAESNFMFEFDDVEGATTSAMNKHDVYEFSDNDQDLVELRPSPLKSKLKGAGEGSSGARAAPPPASDSCDSVSDNDDFVYMSDDYLCSADETENSLLSCETSMGAKLTTDLKKVTAKKKEVVDKNAVMGKIFKNNAVRSDKKSVSKPKESAKSPKADLDQLFDSLLEDEPNSSMLKEDSEPLSAVPPTDKRAPAAAGAGAAPSTTLAVEVLTDTATQTSDTFEKIVQNPQDWLSTQASDKKTTKKKKSVLHTSGIDKPKPQKRCKRSLDISEKEVFEKYSEVLSADRSGNDTPDASAALSLLDESGVARHRARRKCAVGKQNVLAETWSSESEPDEGFSGRGVGSDASSSRKKKSKKSSGVHGGVRRNRHVSFKKQEAALTASVPHEGKSEVEVEPPAPVREARGRSRSEVAYYWSSGDGEGDEEEEEEAPVGSAPSQPPQHGWIVGDSHKKLVTMLAHAKGRKRDDKRHYLD